MSKLSYEDKIEICNKRKRRMNFLYDVEFIFHVCQCVRYDEHKQYI
ncbi:MAG: hypothetical protein ACK5HL_04595 [Bacilli bacterium]